MNKEYMVLKDVDGIPRTFDFIMLCEQFRSGDFKFLGFDVDMILQMRRQLIIHGVERSAAGIKEAFDLLRSA